MWKLNYTIPASPPYNRLASNKVVEHPNLSAARKPFMNITNYKLKEHEECLVR